MGRRTMVASAEPKLTEKLRKASAELKKEGLSEELKGAGADEDLRQNRRERWRGGPSEKPN